MTACASLVRCGAAPGTCCAAGELCINDACAAPTMTACADSFDCPPAERCEPSLGRCVAGPGTASCRVLPDAGILNPTLEWSWTSSATLPTAVHVTAMPVVADLDGDGTPEVVIVSGESASTTTGNGVVRVLSGLDGTEVWGPVVDATLPANRVNVRGTPAVADLDGDGHLEIVTPRQGGGLIAFNSDGSRRWVTTFPDAGAWSTDFAAGAVSVADLDQDGQAELAVGGVVFDVNGVLRFDRGVFAGSNGTFGAASAITDLSPSDPGLELATGRQVLRAAGTVLWDNGLTDGFAAPADLGGDGTPELVVVANGVVRLHDALTGALLTQLTLAAPGAGGPPLLADLDGDGLPELVVASGGTLAAWDYSASVTAFTPLWSLPVQDLSSSRTPATAFDFDGDGAAEVLFNDECTLRVLDGRTGAILFQTDNSTGTILDYPVVADVDGDGHAEVVAVANDFSSTCALHRHGVFVYGDPGFPRARRLWNEHASHRTNILGNGRVPRFERPSFATGLDTWRAAGEGAGQFDVPDLVVSLAARQSGCPAQLELVATVQNRGSRGVPAGVQVAFFSGTTLLDTLATTRALLPGQAEVLTTQVTTSGTFSVTVDGADAIVECVEPATASVTASCN